jgi:hypothetical protein
LIKLRGYVTEHAASWYQYIQGSKGRELANGDLYLITGHEKAPSWGMASYYANNEKFNLSFKPDNTHQYRWVGVSGQINPSQFKSYNGPSGSSNQTVFLHGWTISLGMAPWRRLLGIVTVKTSSIEDLKWSLDRHGGFHVRSPRGQLFLQWPFNVKRASGVTGDSHHAEQAGAVVLSDFPPKSKVLPSQHHRGSSPDRSLGL